MLQVGDKYSEEITISQHQVNLFIEMTGDKNPIHVSDEEAQKAGFKNNSNFISTFHKVMDVSPGQYRQQFRLNFDPGI